MASDVVMPRLGWTMEVGRVVEWLKQDGETVAAGEPIFSVESDKAVVEVEALDSGVLRIPPDSPLGVEAPVGALLAYIVPPGEDFRPPTSGNQGASGENETPAPTSAAAAAAVATNGAVANGATRETPAISPRARRVAAELGVDWTRLTGSGSSGRIRERDVRAAAAAGVGTLIADTPARPRATPATRRLAEEHGVDLSRLAARAGGGRVTRADVAAAALGALPEAGAAGFAPLPGDDAQPMTQIRRITAQRMGEAARTVAPVTLTTDADATELVHLRARLKEELAGSDEIVPSVTDMLARLTALALGKHPALNASIDGETLVRHAAVNLGIAVDAERGLYVPVIRDAAHKSLFQIAEESGRLVAAARTGAVPADALGGGTFTISNLGMFGIDAFTPIVNLPESAILGVGRIVARPVVIDDETEEVAVRRMMALSLTFDHRVVDGAPAARFLQTLVGMIQRPLAWLMR